MKRVKFFDRLMRKRHARQRTAPRTQAADIETLETKQLLSASALFLPATGELNILLDNSENVRVSSSNGNLQVELINGSTITPVTRDRKHTSELQSR